MSEDSLENKRKKVDIVIANLHKEYGDGTIIRMGDEVPDIWPAISTGALTLDKALGIGGLPEGRVVEVYGPESSGKSTLALSVVAESQARGGFCAFIDAEHALDPRYASEMGVQMDELLLSQPDNGEQALEIVDQLVNSGSISVVVVDSVAALTPKAELEGSMEDNHMGLQARLMAQALRKITANVSKTGTLVIFINQLREKIGVMFGNPETTPGGRALKFYASVRLDLRKKETLKSSKTGEHEGVKIKATVRKNKMAPPFEVAEFDILYGHGIDDLGCIVDLATKQGIFTKKGAWYYYQEETIGQGKNGAREFLASDMTLAQELRERVLAR